MLCGYFAPFLLCIYCNTDLQMVLLITEAPEIELDADLKKGLIVRAGCPIRLCATIRGRPPPKVTWRRMGIDNVVRKGHVDIIDTMTFLVIPDSTRDDSGKYSLTLKSPAGEKAVFVNVKVLGKSSPEGDRQCLCLLCDQGDLI